jgi:predicted metal-dependent hydrolase
MTYIKSDVDGNYYLVRNTDDKTQAANMLAKIYQDILKLSDYLETNKNNYKEYKEYIELLHKKAPSIILVESTQDSAYTSYSVNKGEQIVFCLRTKRTGNEIHDYNLVLYVVLHEISHVACPIYDNHGPLFRKIFAFLTKEAINIGIYKRIDFNSKPENYCGMDITDSII